MLTVLAPLRLEARAVSRGAPGLHVVRTGAGPARAASSARALAGAGGMRAVAVAGVAGGLVPGLAPGTVIVADRVLDDSGRQVAGLASVGVIESELRRRGHPVVVGPVVSTPRIAAGARRSELARLGALAVDCETAYLLTELRSLPAAVVRVVVDTPERELRSPATIGGGIRALRRLRQAAPVLEWWAGNLTHRRVLLADPRSFCAGVERAISTVDTALERFGAPVYVRRQIVHNRHVVADLESKGAVFVQELGEIPDGSTVVLSAHGVSPAVRAEAAGRGLHVVDATCPLVAKVHHEVRRFLSRGYQVVMIGHAGHDETEGTLGEGESISLISTVADVDRLEVRDPSRLAYITQTTLAPTDVADIVAELSSRYPRIVGPHAADICYATQNRQEAVAAIAPECDLVLVVGSANSSNAARLVEVVARAGCPARLVDDESEVRAEWLDGVATVGVTAAASTPPALVDGVVAALGALGPVSVESRTTTTEHVHFPLPVEVR